MRLPEFLAMKLREGEVHCPHCDEYIACEEVKAYGIRESQEAGMLTIFIMVDCRRCRTSFGYDVRTMPAPVYLSCVRRLYGSSDPKEAPEPSILPGTPDEPISAGEAERLISRIRRLSPKTDSQSWRQFLQELQEDADRRRPPPEETE